MRFFIIIIYILSLVLGGCSEKHKIINNEQEEAKQTLINYIGAINENNYDEQLRYLSRWKVNDYEQNRIRWGIIHKYEYMRVVNIALDDSENSRDGYLQHGRGKFTEPSKLLVFKVDLEFKPISNGIEPNVDSKVSWKYFLIKEKENDTWKIDDWGN